MSQAGNNLKANEEASISEPPAMVLRGTTTPQLLVPAKRWRLLSNLMSVVDPGADAREASINFCFRG